MGEQMGGYRMVITGKSQEGEMWPGINGGITPRGGSTLPVQGDAVNAFVCTVEVEDIDVIITKIAKSGGTEAVEKIDVLGVGLLSYQKDPEGNLFGVLQPIQPAK